MNKKVVALLVALIATVAVILGALIISTAKTSDTDESSQSSSTISVGIPIGNKVEGLPELEVFYDYTCYHCAVAEKNLGDYIFDNAGTDFNLTLQPVLTVGQPFTQLATEALLVTYEKQPNKVPAFHQALFEYSLKAMENNESEILSNSEKSFEEIKKLAASVGIQQDTIALFPEASDLMYLRAATDSWINRSDIIRTSEQIGTPEFVLDGVPIERTSSDPEEDLEAFRENF